MGTQGVAEADLQSRIDAVQWPTSFEDYHESGLPPRQISFSFQTDRPSDLGSGPINFLAEQESI